eukprot:c9103_g1_i1 orf=2-232(-)
MQASPIHENFIEYHSLKNITIICQTSSLPCTSFTRSGTACKFERSKAKQFLSLQCMFISCDYLWAFMEGLQMLVLKP